MSPALVGLHMRTDGGNTDADFLAAKTANIEAFKWLSVHPIEDVRRAKREFPHALHICRIYENLNGRHVTPQDFASWQTGPDTSMRRMYAEGVRLFEIGNEPNLVQEGWTQSWQHGAEFAWWFIEVRRLLLLAFPDAKLGFPGVSPGGDINNVRTDSTRFLNQAKSALQSADWVAAHSYEVGTDGFNAGGAWKIVRDMVPGKPIAITEFSSPLQTPEVQAKQYRAYYERLRNEPNLFAAFSFAVSGTHFQHECWRKENGELTPIPFEVARRNFSDPIPTPMTPLYTSRIDRNGANIRNWQGQFVKLIPPNSEIAVYTKPQTIGGWPKRVVVNPALGYNVLADRILSPVPEGVKFFWPTDYRTVTQRFGENPNEFGYGPSGHEGIDLRAPTGTNVYACLSGRVIAVGNFGAYGLHVKIRHSDNLETEYCHFQSSVVRVNDDVAQGQLIGKADSTGNSRGSHLHLNVYVGGRRVDPAPYLGV